uniref:potassium channel family protein n=1 Tax=Thaumasiovibrio occultus TaxID=1891184 RepID=UPI000B34EC46|nr:potassium channel family protein [Thaumasiovibrio occultus]
MMNKNTSRDHELYPLSLMSFGLSLVSLIVITFALLYHNNSEIHEWLLKVDATICVIFWSQLLFDLWRSNDRRHYLSYHWIDFVASVPLIGFLRYARIVQIFRIIRLFRQSRHVLSRLAQEPTETTFASLILLLTLIFTVGSTSMLMAESTDPNASINSISDAIWWVLVTISTVGYGDYFPVTFWGRVVAAAVIVSGIAIFGMIAGLVSSGIQKRHQAKAEEEADQDMRILLANQHQILAKLSAIEKRLDALDLDAQSTDAQDVDAPEREKDRETQEEKHRDARAENRDTPEDH